MPTDATNSNAQPLDFSPASGAGTATCAKCGTALRGSYHLVNDAVTCANCRYAAEAQAGEGVFTRALGFGVLAALAGAALYGAFIYVTGWQVGYLTALVGIGVGQAVRKGSRERGGRRYQILAATLAYLAMGASIVPAGAKEFIEGMNQAKVSAPAQSAAPADSSAEEQDSTAVETAASTDDSSAAPTAEEETPAPARTHAAAGKHVEPSAGLFALGFAAILIGGLLALFALPVLVALSSPLSGLIMGFAVFRAWRQNAGETTTVTVSGPYKLGPPPRVA